MKTICLYFQIHQPFRLKRYRFFNIGGDHYYYDDFANEDIIQRIAETSYIPANRLLLDMINESGGKFKVTFSISGLALEQLIIYVPEVVDGLRELAKTGCVEFLAEPFAHSLASLIDPEGFKQQVIAHSDRIEELFDKRPKVLRNSELIFSDDIAMDVYDMGYRGMIIEGAKRTLGWKSPNYVYQSAIQPKLKLLLRNPKFSTDMAYRFSDYTWNEYPLTAEKFMNWIAQTPPEEQIINMFMPYESLGLNNPRGSGIFDFTKVLPKYAAERQINFSTPSEVLSTLKPVDSLSSTHAISWAGEEKDVSPWLGNILQQEAFNKLYELKERIRFSDVRRLKQDWMYLQASDHFYYMSTKMQLPYSPYPSPYEAFSNYMNVLSDFIERVNSEYPSSIDNEELNSLLQTIHNQADEIEKLESELDKQKKKALTVRAKATGKANLN
ncbi:alpha-amylase [Dysgonomonas sp. 216]|uniref:glycoside hydrolase family 57 protein n=1 Tax=Dysgonomonas sp. 216 TaxID=2302934 RepID=UPI0013D0ABE2|nr:glycoside hydrolase family 57 protein [Dysgonomonas sp. 216]NDW19385.1 alpha-amylase [Dysgonomonas sp. 216]